jgi:hypothetical protein
MGDGSFLVSDARFGRVFHLDREFKITGFFGSRGYGENEFYLVQGILPLPDGRVVFSDCYAGQLKLYDSDRRFIKAFSSEGTEEGNLFFPEALCSDDEGNILCGETGNRRVSLFDKEFNFKRALYPRLESNNSPYDSVHDSVPDSMHDAAYDSEEASFNPFDCVYLKRKEQYLVVDGNNECLQIFAKNGKWVDSVGEFQ